jgi:hypothetical protein
MEMINRFVLSMVDTVRCMQMIPSVFCCKEQKANDQTRNQNCGLAGAYWLWIEDMGSAAGFLGYRPCVGLECEFCHRGGGMEIRGLFLQAPDFIHEEGIMS